MRTRAQAFNEWMRLYIEEPETFRREFDAIVNYKRDMDGGKEPAYGDRCDAFLTKLMEAK